MKPIGAKKHRRNKFEKEGKRRAIKKPNKERGKRQ
jgi:hypothetical protein